MRKCFVLKEGLYHELFYHLVTISRNAPGVLDSRIGISCSAGSTPANGAGLGEFFGWVLIRVLLDGWKRVTL